MRTTFAKHKRLGDLVRKLVEQWDSDAEAVASSEDEDEDGNSEHGGDLDHNMRILLMMEKMANVLLQNQSELFLCAER